MTVPTMYSIQAAVREFIGDITVAQFDESPAAVYKLALIPHTQPVTNPSSDPDTWHDPDTAYNVQGLWVGAGGTVTPSASLEPYVLWVAQLVDDVWSQPRRIGIVFVGGLSTGVTPSTNQATLKVFYTPVPDDVVVPPDSVYFYVDGDTVSIAAGGSD